MEDVYELLLGKQGEKLEELGKSIEEKLRVLKSEPPVKEKERTEDEIKLSRFLTKAPPVPKPKEKELSLAKEVHKRELENLSFSRTMNRSQVNNSKDSAFQSQKPAAKGRKGKNPIVPYNSYNWAQKARRISALLPKRTN